MTNEFEIEVTNRLDSLPVIGGFLKDVMTSFNIDEEKAYDILTAVDEACANIIEYAFTDGLPDKIKVSCSKYDNKFEVRICDRGKPFDITSVKEPDLTSDLEKRKEGGLGIYFIKQLMDELRYEYKNGQETLTLVKYI